MSEKNILIATYGSLRQRMQNVTVNAAAGAEYIGRGKTVENFDLFRFGGSYFPSVSLKHSESGSPVVVDIFATDMKGLLGPYDRLEGHDPDDVENSFYNRTKIEVQMDNGDVVEAWIYHIDEVQHERIESGDWCLHNIPNYYSEEEA